MAAKANAPKRQLHNWKAVRAIGYEHIPVAFEQLENDGFDIVDQWQDGVGAVMIIAKRPREVHKEPERRG